MEKEQTVIPFKIALSVLWSVIWRWLLILGGLGLILGAIWVAAAAVYHNTAASHVASSVPPALVASSVTSTGSAGTIGVQGSAAKSGSLLVSVIYLIILPLEILAAAYVMKLALSKTHFGYRIELVKKEDDPEGK